MARPVQVAASSGSAAVQMPPVVPRVVEAPPPPMVIQAPPAGPAVDIPESPPRPRSARATRREEFDRFVAQEYPGLLAEVTILLDDRTRATRRLRRALVGTWREWDRVREGVDPTAQVRERVLARIDHGGRPGGRREPSPGRPLTLIALAELPSVQRQALVLHHVLGRTVEQVAVDTGSATATVRQRLCHGAWALANHHPQVRAVPLPRAAPRPRPDARTRVLTDVLDGWAATELEGLRETMRLELAAEQKRSAGARVRHHDQRRLAITAAAAAVGAAGAVALVAASVHALEHTTPAPVPALPHETAVDGASGPGSPPAVPGVGDPIPAGPADHPGPVPIAPRAGTAPPAAGVPLPGSRAAAAPAPRGPLPGTGPAPTSPTVRVAPGSGHTGSGSSADHARPAMPRVVVPAPGLGPAPAPVPAPAPAAPVVRPSPDVPHPPARVLH